MVHCLSLKRWGGGDVAGSFTWPIRGCGNGRAKHLFEIPPTPVRVKAVDLCLYYLGQIMDVNVVVSNRYVLRRDSKSRFRGLKIATRSRSTKFYINFHPHF